MTPQLLGPDFSSQRSSCYRGIVNVRYQIHNPYCVGCEWTRRVGPPAAARCARPLAGGYAKLLPLHGQLLESDGFEDSVSQAPAGLCLRRGRKGID
jgi:hypothetical protein